MIEASRGEDGCDEYVYVEAVLEPGPIHAKESCRDQAALDRQFASKHLAAWRVAWAKPEIGGRDRRVMRRCGSRRCRPATSGIAESQKTETAPRTVPGGLLDRATSKRRGERGSRDALRGRWRL